MFEFLCKKTINKLKDKIKHLQDTNVYYEAKKQYMVKKQVLLDLHRQNKDTHSQKKLIIEINIIAEFINGDKINEEDIANTLLVFPVDSKS